MKLNRQEITYNIIEIMNKIRYQPEVYVEENFNITLTGDTIQWCELDLLYLVIELIEEFGVCFEKKDFENYRFNTINDIVNIICSKENF
jgi:acyl carrier protein